MLPVSIIVKKLSGTPASTPALKIQLHSSSAPFEGVQALFITHTAEFLETEFPKPSENL